MVGIGQNEKQTKVEMIAAIALLGSRAMKEQKRIKL